MGEIIALRARATTARALAPPGGDAEILFFLGVRYMRMDEPLVVTTGAPNERDQSGPGKKRKRTRKKTLCARLNKTAVIDPFAVFAIEQA
jgi:hypothetical protein